MDGFLLAIGILVALAYLALWVMLREPTHDPEVLRALEHPHTLVLDVREPVDYRDDHYPGALNIPLTELRERVDELGDRDRHVIVYCDTGLCSGRATRILREAGFRHVVDAGHRAGLPNPTTEVASAVWAERHTRPTP